MTVKSGYLNNPPKVIVIEGDNRAGSYPGLSSPQDISRSPETNRPYRDDIIPLSKSPYATAKIIFLSKIPALGSTITLVSASGNTSTFTFKTYSPFSPFGPYDVNVSGISVSTSDVITNNKAAALVSQRFIETLSRVPECQITAEPGEIPGEVVLRQTIPGSAGNTAVSTTVSSSRLSIESFSGGNSTEIRYPYRMILDDTDSQTSEVVRRFIKSERSGTLSAPGDAYPMEFTAPSDQHPYTLHSPFDESNAHQSFGLSGGSDTYGTQTEIYGDFFTRGSTLGPLDEPLSTKDKIVIDLTPVETTSIWHYPKNPNLLGFNNHQMMYYNFSDKKWDRLGFGTVYNDSAPTLQQWLDRHYIGFSQNCNNQSNLNPDDATYEIEIYDLQLKSSYDQVIGGGTGAGSKRAFIESGYASPIDTFGFPFHPKYHATSSQTLDVSSLVDRPFLVEKIVYEFSGSAPKMGILSGAVYYPGPNLNRTFISPSATFFILNQRKANPDPGQESSFTNVYIASTNSGLGSNVYLPPKDQTDFRIERYENGGIPQSRVLSPGGPPTYVDSVRDLVTFARVGAVWPTYKEEVVDTLIPGFPHPAEFMDLAIEVPASGTFDGIYTLAADVKTPSNNPALTEHIVTGSGITSGSTGFLTIYTAKDTSTRNSVDIPTGRSLRGEFNAAEIDYKITNKTNPAGSRTATYGVRRDAEASPYIIMPGDKLIFGWQSSFTLSSRNIIDPDVQSRVYGFPFVIGPGAGKLVLYGSYLRDNKPVHDIYKDQLISDSVHEAIPAGPSVLDMFDTEPTMVFSGSMREEYIRGEMFERRSTWYGDTSLIPISVDSKKVRKVRGRASDGNLGKRSSFSRNTKAFQEDSQYYDSMQLDPVKTLMNYSGSSTLSLRVANSINYIFLGAPGESYNGPGSAFIEAASNRKFIGSFAFEPNLYSGIERVRKINSLSFSNAKAISIDLITGAPRPNQKIDVIGYVTGSSLSSSVSSLIRPGGLAKNGFPIIGSFGPQNNGFLYPQSSPGFDTNPSDSETGQFGVTTFPFALGTYDGIWNFINTELDFSGVNYHLSRLMGCFGDGFMRMTQYSFNLFYPGYFNIFGQPIPTFPLVYDWPNSPPPISGSTNLLYGQIYRGTRYGLINPTPLYANCTFSGTRYGQFRDLLEQRQFTVFESDAGGSDGVPVQVIFIDRETGSSLPVGEYSGTNSINLSDYCTSSLPYFDGEVRDRALPLPEQSIYYVPVFPTFSP